MEQLLDRFAAALATPGSSATTTKTPTDLDLPRALPAVRAVAKLFELQKS